MSESLTQSDEYRLNAGGSTCMDLESLISEFHEALYRYAFRLAGSAADAEDLIQQTFLIAHKKLHQVREPERVRGWLFTILRSCYLKSQRKRVPIPVPELECTVDEISNTSIEDRFVDSQAIQLAINSLPDYFKIVVMMFYFEELSYKEIALRLDIKEGTVMSRLARAKGKLRQSLMEDFSPLPSPESHSSENPFKKTEPKQDPFSNFGKSPRKQLFL